MRGLSTWPWVVGNAQGSRNKGKRTWGRQRVRWLDSTTHSTDKLSKLQKIVKDKEAWYAAARGVAKSQQLSSGAATIYIYIYIYIYIIRGYLYICI